MEYDYKGKMFRLKKYTKNGEIDVTYKIKSVGIEKFDHPFLEILCISIKLRILINIILFRL